MQARNVHARIAQECTPTGALWIVDLEGVASAVAKPMADKCNAFGRQAERAQPPYDNNREGAASSSPPSFRPQRRLARKTLPQ